MSDELTVKIKVTQEAFDKNFSIDDWFNFSKLTNLEIYNKMLLFVVDDEGEPVTIEEARRLFKNISKKEWPDYVSRFMQLVGEAFVSPTSGGS